MKKIWDKKMGSYYWEHLSEHIWNMDKPFGNLMRTHREQQNPVKIHFTIGYGMTKLAQG
jgi:hypothetical protein